MMKRLTYITVAFMLMIIFIGCFATVTPDQRKELYDMRGSVGNAPFVGESSSEAKGLAYYQMHGY